MVYCIVVIPHFTKGGGKASYVTKPDVRLEDEGSYVLTVKAANDIS